LDKNSNSFTVLFATIVCVVLAVCLAATFNSLKGTIDANAAFDKQKNVLIAMGMLEKGDASKSRSELEDLYETRVVGEVLEVIHGVVEETVRQKGVTRQEKVERVTDLHKTDYALEDLPALRREQQGKPAGERKEFLPIYRGLDENGETSTWCIPISGYGLWSTLYGFLALDRDLNTVVGITFYEHKETPGLGGEVDNVRWQHSWRGKKILDERGKLVGVAVKKGTVDPKVPFEAAHKVDGLSGATLTSNGVTRFVMADLEIYEPYFAKQRKQ